MPVSYKEVVEQSEKSETINKFRIQSLKQFCRVTKESVAVESRNIYAMSATPDRLWSECTAVKMKVNCLHLSKNVCMDSKIQEQRYYVFQHNTINNSRTIIPP